MSSKPPIKIATSHTRTFAFLIDLFLFYFLARASFLPFIYPKNWNLLEFKDILTINIWYYTVFFLFYLAKDCFKGQSFGKWFVNVKVVYVKEGLKAPGFFKSWLRNLFLIAIPVELAFFLFDKLHRRIGDRYIGSAVVKHEKKFVIRDLTNRLLATLLVAAFIWILDTLSSPQLVKKSSFYQAATIWIDNQKNEKVIDKKNVGYFKELYLDKDNKDKVSLILPMKTNNKNQPKQLKIYFEKKTDAKDWQIESFEIIKNN